MRFIYESTNCPIFDIDGTLFDSKTKSILPSTKYMLEELRKRQNYDLYLSSGRSYVTLGTLKPYEKYFKGMNLTNGQEIYMHNDIYYGEGIDKEIIKIFYNVQVNRIFH